jgi:hypothetical protein
VKIDGFDCASAGYSWPDETYIILGSFNAEPKTVVCRVGLKDFVVLASSSSSAEIISGSGPARLDVRKLTGGGENITIPADNAVVIRLK